MKKLYLLLSVLFLIYWGCEDEQDTTSTGVTLWGEVYSVEETDSLDLSGSYSNHHNLGEIPSYIGELSYLNTLTLSTNQNINKTYNISNRIDSFFDV